MKKTMIPGKIYRIDELAYAFNRVKKNTVIVLDINKKNGEQDPDRIDFCLTYYKDLHGKIEKGIIDPVHFIPRVLKAAHRRPPGCREEIGTVSRALEEIIDQLRAIRDGNGGERDTSSVVESLKLVIDALF